MAEISDGLIFPPGVYVEALTAELGRVTDTEHRAAIVAELERLGVRSTATAPRKERR